jgi:hypothetical protein
MQTIEMHPDIPDDGNTQLDERGGAGVSHAHEMNREQLFIKKRDFF